MEACLQMAYDRSSAEENGINFKVKTSALERWPSIIVLHVEAKPTTDNQPLSENHADAQCQGTTACGGVATKGQPEVQLVHQSHVENLSMAWAAWWSYLGGIALVAFLFTDSRMPPSVRFWSQ